MHRLCSTVRHAGILAKLGLRSIDTFWLGLAAGREQRFRLAHDCLFTATTTSEASGNFLISGVPTVKGKISASATVTVAGKTLKGTSASVSPVLAGETVLGTITVKSASNVGYYDITLGSGTGS